MAEDIAEKIRNLLARAERTESESEAETCLRIARRLADEHAIDLLQLDRSGVAPEWIRREVWCGKRHPPWLLPVSDVVDMFWVRTLLGWRVADDQSGVVKAVRVFGREQHIPLAVWLWQYLPLEFRLAYRAADKRTRGTQPEFFQSMSLALCIKIDKARRAERTTAQSQQEWALCVQSHKAALDAALANVPPAPAAKMAQLCLAGLKAGEALPLNQPLSGPAPNEPARIGQRLLLTEAR